MAILLSDSYKVINWDLSSKMLDTVYWGKTTDSGRGVKVAINQNGVLKTPTTETMRINFKKPSGLQIFIDGVISGNYFVFDFTEQVYAEQGNVSAELMLNVSSEFVMSSTFIIEVNQSFTSAIESSSELTALQTALADVDEVKADIAILNTDVDALQNPVFTEASTLSNVNSGESGATLWGKVKKYFSFASEILTGAISFTNSSYATVGTTNNYVYNNHSLDLVFIVNVVATNVNWTECYTLPLSKTNAITYYTRMFRNGGTSVADGGVECKIEGNKLYLRNGITGVNYMGTINIITNN